MNYKLTGKPVLNYELRRIVLRNANWSCELCGFSPLTNEEKKKLLQSPLYFLKKPHFSNLHIHHRIPKSKGGANYIYYPYKNLQVLCDQCHKKVHEELKNE